eukprot:4907647-Pleurochrysis_carterae.AAC.1
MRAVACQQLGAEQPPPEELLYVSRHRRFVKRDKRVARARVALAHQLLHLLLVDLHRLVRAQRGAARAADRARILGQRRGRERRLGGGAVVAAVGLDVRTVRIVLTTSTSTVTATSTATVGRQRPPMGVRTRSRGVFTGSTGVLANRAGALAPVRLGESVEQVERGVGVPRARSVIPLHLGEVERARARESA